MADGVLLERAGVPAVSICTDAFRVPGEAMAKAYGFPGYRFLVVPHPLASLDQQQISERVSTALAELVGIVVSG
ncbi:hypothetical protein FHX36_000781 [Modestobacter versicolor]|uniref:UGSC-like domain-containing protein n=1 Tax=Modestobacter versicolor TaxID=429133 RepID=A0A323VX82_9ACTN|nr:hypothetical protein [Modestobacter versicolor]MBB3675046.1 hypothetical protein [Modestobacter versicolor]PZA23358.1 hypothetical protein DMO24_00240 [Modestobacter versicolor]